MRDLQQDVLVQTELRDAHDGRSPAAAAVRVQEVRQDVPLPPDPQVPHAAAQRQDGQDLSV